MTKYSFLEKDTSFEIFHYTQKPERMKQPNISNGKKKTLTEYHFRPLLPPVQTFTAMNAMSCTQGRIVSFPW